MSSNYKGDVLDWLANKSLVVILVTVLLLWRGTITMALSEDPKLQGKLSSEDIAHSYPVRLIFPIPLKSLSPGWDMRAGMSGKASTAVTVN